MKAFAAALAAFAVRRRGVVLLLWVAIAFAATTQSKGMDKLLYGSVGPMPGSGSSQVDERLSSGFDSPYAQFFVITLERTSGVADVDATAAQLALDLGHQPDVAKVLTLSEVDPLRAALLVGLKCTSSKQTEALVVPTRAWLDQRFGPTTGIRALLTGQAPIGKDVVSVASQEAGRAEQRVLPFTFLALLLAFGSFGAAFLPVLSGVAAVVVSMGVLGVIARITPLSVYATNIVSMLGLGLGIDYALFVVARVREEARDGVSELEAVLAACRHAAPSIAISGTALMIGLAGMASVPYRESSGMGIGGVVVGAVSALVALTLLPAAAALLGRWLEAPRALSRRLSWTSSRQRWEAMAGHVLRRPVWALAVALIILGTLAWPITRLELGDPEPSLLPSSMQGIAAVHALEAMGLRKVMMPVRILVETNDGSPVLTPRRLKALAEFTSQLRADPRVDRVVALVDPQNGASKLATGLALLGEAGVRKKLPPEAGTLISRDGRAVAVTLLLKEQERLKDARDYVRELRLRDWRALDARVVIGGPPAFSAEFIAAAHNTYPRVLVAIAAATLLMLGFMTRSVLIPIKAVVSNTLTVLAALGATTWLFQSPWASALIGLPEPSLTIPAGIPLITYCVVFGLSMDYEVFLISRILEAHEAGASDAEAVQTGIGASGGVITAAAVIMSIVFLGFAITPLLPIKLLGTALMLGVFLDATVVRLLLIPSIMVLAGRWNWWPGGGARGT